MPNKYLSLRVNNADVTYKLDDISFEKLGSRAHFILKSSENNDIFLTVPYVLPLNEDFHIEQYRCYPFMNPEFSRENDISEVYVKAENVGRIGWIFPVQALVSHEHSFAENIHFQRYCWVTFNQLLRGNLFSTSLVLDINYLEGEVSLVDIYSSQLLILTLSNIKTALIANFTIDSFLPALYVHKYIFCDDQLEIKNLIKHVSDDASPAKIKIVEMSDILRDDVYINALYKVHLKETNHPLVQFHLLYQIIELLITRIFDCEVIKILNQSESIPHKIAQNLKAITSEDNRIKKLYECYLLSNKERNNINIQLVKACNFLLANFNEEKDHVSDAFYHVRNLVVHRFRDVTAIDNGIELLHDINREFEYTLTDILCHYTEPKLLSDEYSNLPTAWLIYKALVL